jgi:hypothetical protein
MTTTPEQPAPSPQRTPALEEQLLAAARALELRRAAAAPYVAEARCAEHDLHRLQREQRTVRHREQRITAMRRGRVTARITLAVYGVFAFGDALVLAIHGHGGTEMFTAAAGALGAAAVIPPAG